MCDFGPHPKRRGRNHFLSLLFAQPLFTRPPFLPKWVFWEKGPKGERGEGDRGPRKLRKSHRPASADNGGMCRGSDPHSGEWAIFLYACGTEGLHGSMEHRLQIPKGEPNSSSRRCNEVPRTDPFRRIPGDRSAASPRPPGCTPASLCNKIFIFLFNLNNS